MFREPTRLAAIATFVVTCLAGCDAHVEPLEVSRPLLVSSTPPSTEGPWAECQLAEDDTSGWARTICPDPGPDGEELTCAGSYVSELQDDDTTWCEVTALCNYPCGADADCPQPQSGDVTPVCNYVCALPCDQGSTCPDGMTCHHEDHGDGKDFQGYCRYVYQCP